MSNHIDVYVGKSPKAHEYVARVYSRGRDVRGGMVVLTDFTGPTIDNVVDQVIENSKSGLGALPHYIVREEPRFTKKLKATAGRESAGFGMMAPFGTGSTDQHHQLDVQGFYPVDEKEYARARTRLTEYSEAFWSRTTQDLLKKLAEVRKTKIVARKSAKRA